MNFKRNRNVYPKQSSACRKRIYESEISYELLPSSLNIILLIFNSDSKRKFSSFLEMSDVSTKFASLASILLTQGLYAVSPSILLEQKNKKTVILRFNQWK